VTFQEHYSVADLRAISARVGQRQGWDFSRMNTSHPATPWEYVSVVRGLLRATDTVIDIGTGGGERLLELSSDACQLLGVDPDPEMITRARGLAADEGATSVHFETGTGADILEQFDVVLDRHAPFEAEVIHRLLCPGGRCVTQQVGEHNMSNVREAFQLEANAGAPISPEMFIHAGFIIERFDEYDVDYVIRDMDSLVFWLQALDGAHSDFGGFDSERDADAINRFLSTSLTDEGVVTNEHRYLLVANKPG
jgi:SAM-dependent methyltransferase